MINTKLTIDGTEHTDFLNMKVDSSSGDYSTSSYFQVQFDNPFGRHASSFNVGEEVIVYADKDASATTKIFTGVLEKISFLGVGTHQKVVLTGRDYTSRLMDLTVEPIVYTSSEISTIITDIFSNAGITDITTTNVDTTGTTLARIAFNQTTIYDSIKQLAELAGFYFYIDVDKDLNFKQNLTTSSGVTFNNENILKQRFDTTREGMANDIWVYGDRSLAGFKENISADGGSVFTLLSKPHNTFVEYLGIPKVGDVYQMVSVPTSGTNYLVNYFDKELIFVSGTDIGYSSIPASGGSILVTYDRDLPIVKHGLDRVSQSLYMKKTKIINDKSIKDPQTASSILKKELENADPFKGMEVDLKGWYSLVPGETVNIELDDFNLDEEDIPILSISYTFDKNTIYSENVVKVKFNKKIKDVTDELANIKRRIDVIEAGDRQDSDIITRLEQATGSALVVGSYWEVKIKNIAGRTLILDDPVYGRLDYQELAGLGMIWGNTSFAVWGTAQWGEQFQKFILGHRGAAILGTSELGENEIQWETVYSGGYY